jgi:hypothetical protein
MWLKPAAGVLRGRGGDAGFLERRLLRLLQTQTQPAGLELLLWSVADERQQQQQQVQAQHHQPLPLPVLGGAGCSSSSPVAQQALQPSKKQRARQRGMVLTSSPGVMPAGGLLSGSHLPLLPAARGQPLLGAGGSRGAPAVLGREQQLQQLGWGDAMLQFQQQQLQPATHQTVRRWHHSVDDAAVISSHQQAACLASSGLAPMQERAVLAGQLQHASSLLLQQQVVEQPLVVHACSLMPPGALATLSRTGMAPARRATTDGRLRPSANVVRHEQWPPSQCEQLLQPVSQASAAATRLLEFGAPPCRHRHQQVAVHRLGARGRVAVQQLQADLPPLLPPQPAEQQHAKAARALCIRGLTNASGSGSAAASGVCAVQLPQVAVLRLR